MSFLSGNSSPSPLPPLLPPPPPPPPPPPLISILSTSSSLSRKKVIREKKKREKASSTTAKRDFRNGPRRYAPLTNYIIPLILENVFYSLNITLTLTRVKINGKAKYPFVKETIAPRAKKGRREYPVKAPYFLLNGSSNDDRYRELSYDF
ncbi:hypothetical protein QBC39DRAFT_331598 [Podospora conica]|nr:hypothetical protein QBC39DRAFT_331598 [Schizothecium conicum]